MALWKAEDDEYEIGSNNSTSIPSESLHTFVFLRVNKFVYFPSSKYVLPSYRLTIDRLNACLGE